MFSPALSALWCFSHAISHAIWPVLVVPVMQLVVIVHLQMGMDSCSSDVHIDNNID